jgi:hypothetical protein
MVRFEKICGAKKVSCFVKIRQSVTNSSRRSVETTLIPLTHYDIFTLEF